MKPENTCVHKWEPGAVLDEPGKFCKCGRFEQINKREFKERFRISFWRWHKAYCDAHVWGGYARVKENMRGR